MKYRWQIVVAFVALFLLLVASCSFSTRRSANQPLRGRMLLWHSLNESETEAINLVVNSFTELNPKVSIKVQAFSNAEELNEQFVNATTTGLGPDVILTPSSWMQHLAASRLISSIDDHLTEAVIGRYNPTIFSMLQIDGQTFGLPLSLDTLALYVNNQLVETPANSFTSLLEQANSGTTVLLPINFSDAFWGIQAFGGQLFNEDGQTILDQGGFANWLAWLRDARNAPGMLQDTNHDVLRQRFMTGNAGYFVGYASELSEILAAFEPNSVTVHPLPNGPVGPAGPFVSSQAFLFSSVSSANQRLLATEFAKFITNGEQSGRLMRLARFVPANINVRINPRLYPIVAAFAGQARNAIPMPTRPEFDAVVRLGNEAYIRALEGAESPAQVAFDVNNTINDANGFAVQAEPNYACNGLGSIFLAHSWQDAEDLAVLDNIIERFRRVCPLVIIETQPLLQSQFVQQFTVADESGFRPTFGLVPQTQLMQLLAPDPLVKNVNNVLPSSMLQRFTPVGIEAMRSQSNLFGLPFVLEVDALYYNRQLVTTPAQTVDDLRSQSMTGIPIILNTDFEKAFWGLHAFGGNLFADNGAALFDQGGMADWLLWLRESRDSYGIQLNSDSDEILRRFLAGESAYLVAGADELAELQEGLGEELGIALLPSGPAGTAQPLVQAQGFVLRDGITEAAQSLALEFMGFATDIDSQNLLMNEAQKIPVNANVSTANSPFFTVLVEQAQTGFLLPNASFWQPITELGEAAYEDVLDNGLDPTDVVIDLTTAINRANGIVVTPTPTVPAPPEEILRDEPEAAATEEDGNITGDVTPSPVSQKEATQP